MKKRFLVLLLAAAACGGKSATEATPPAAKHAGHDHEAQPPAPDPQPEEEGTPRDPDQAKADLLAAETAAFEKAKPVFDKHCAKCHAKGGKKAKPKTLDHFDMTSYPFGGHHAGEIAAEIRKVLAIGGGKATMPLDQPGAVTGDELSLIAAWADAFEKSHAAGAHKHHGHGEHHEGGDHRH